MNYAVYIVAALVLVLLIALVALAISWLQKTVLRNIRNKTMGLLSAYDELLEEKSKELTQLAQLSEQAQQQPEPSPTAIQSEQKPESMSGAALNSIQRATATDYREDTIGSYYQLIRQYFSYDLDTVLPELERVNPETEGPATMLLKKLDYDIVYQLSTLAQEDQLEILRSVLNQEELQLLEDYLQGRPRFNMLGFYDNLQSVAATEPGKARLLVSTDVANYCAGKHQAEIIGDPEICEGFQIEQNNRLYDFSIRARELS